MEGRLQTTRERRGRERGTGSSHVKATMLAMQLVPLLLAVDPLLLEEEGQLHRQTCTPSMMLSEWLEST